MNDCRQKIITRSIIYGDSIDASFRFGKFYVAADKIDFLVRLRTLFRDNLLRLKQAHDLLEQIRNSILRIGKKMI